MEEEKGEEDQEEEGDCAWVPDFLYLRAFVEFEVLGGLNFRGVEVWGEEEWGCGWKEGEEKGSLDGLKFGGFEG